MTKTRGLTLVELLVALGIAAVVGGIATRQMVEAIRFSERSQESMEMERSKVGLQRELSRVWSRARRVTSSGGNAGLLPFAGYTVNTTGAPVGYVTWVADMRPCVPDGTPLNKNFFNPISAVDKNPMNAALNSSYTLVYLTCCGGAVNAKNPYGGAPVAVPSACKNGGVTLNYRRFDRNDSYCYGDYARANVNAGNLGATFNRLRFAAAGWDHSFDIYAPTALSGGVDKQTGAPGRALPSYTPAGGTDLLYYLSLWSQETTTTGGSAVNAKGAIQSQLNVAADIANVTEFYSRLGNRTTSRLIPCGGGVERP